MFFITNSVPPSPPPPLFARIGILLTYGKQLHDHNRSLTPAIFDWSICTMPGKWAVMHECRRYLFCLHFYDLSNGFWNWADSVVFFALYQYTSIGVNGCTKSGKRAIVYLCQWFQFCLFLRFFYLILELFRQYGIFLYFYFILL